MEEQFPTRKEIPAEGKKVSLAKIIIINAVITLVISSIVSAAVCYCLVGNRLILLENGFAKISGKIKINGQ